MLARRLLILAAVLMGLVALAAGVAPRAPERDTTSPPPARGAATPTAPIERTLLASGSDQDIEANVGQTVIISVETEELDSVSLGDYGIETADPQSPARFELLADVPGSYPIHLLEADRTIGTLEVR